MLQMARLDLRGLPVWDRPGAVFEAFDRLTDGEMLTVVTENEPRGLAASLQQTRGNDFLLAPRRVGAQEWHVTLRHSKRGVESSQSAALSRSPVFCDLPELALHALAQAGTAHSSRRGGTIVPENSEWPYIGLVFEGTLALATGSASRNRIFYEIGEGEIFGENEFFDNGLTVGRTIVLTKAARFFRIPYDAVRNVAAMHPDLFVALAHICAQRSRLLAEMLSAQNTQPILSRIANVLVQYSVAEKGLAPAAPPLPSLTQSQIAAAAGTVKEVAARAIADLENRGLLKRERGHIRFLDRQGLLDLIRTPAA